MTPEVFSELDALLLSLNRAIGRLNYKIPNKGPYVKTTYQVLDHCARCVRIAMTGSGDTDLELYVLERVLRNHAQDAADVEPASERGRIRFACKARVYRNITRRVAAIRARHEGTRR